MTLDLGDALTDGASRALKRNGLYLFVVFFVLTLVSVLATQTLMEVYFAFLQQIVEQQPGQQPDQMPFFDGQDPFSQSFPLALPIPWPAAVTLLVGTWIVGEAARIVSDRSFVSDRTASLHEPTRNLPLAVINGVIATFLIVFFLWLSLVTVVGPIVLAVLFFFTRQEIAVQDKNVIDALVDSVKLTKGNRVEVFALALILFIIIELTTALFGFLPGIAGPLVTAAVVAALGVFNSAVAAQAYRQLAAERRDGDEDVEEERVGALTADDLDRSNQVQQTDSFGTVDFDVGDEDDPQEEDPAEEDADADDEDPSVR